MSYLCWEPLTVPPCTVRSNFILSLRLQLDAKKELAKEELKTAQKEGQLTSQGNKVEGLKKRYVLAASPTVRGGVRARYAVSVNYRGGSGWMRLRSSARRRRKSVIDCRPRSSSCMRIWYVRDARQGTRIHTRIARAFPDLFDCLLWAACVGSVPGSP